MSEYIKYAKRSFRFQNFKASFYRRWINTWMLLHSPFCPLGIDKIGFCFWWKGDQVWLVWPWKRKDKKERYLSLGFSGTGEFGDAYFKSLEDLDKMWDEYSDYELEKHIASLHDKDVF